MLNLSGELPPSLIDEQLWNDVKGLLKYVCDKGIMEDLLHDVAILHHIILSTFPT
jgi:hypothetical protein